MKLFRFLSYPVFYFPASPRAADYVMEHFYRIRSNTRLRQLLKRLGRPVIPILGRRECLSSHPQFERLRPYLAGGEIEVVIDSRRFFRLIDFNRRKVVNIFKDNDLLLYFTNEIEAREKLSGLDILPGLISVDKSKRVFIEEYVCEHPFKSARLRDLDAGDLAGRVKEVLRQVRVSAPVRTVEANEYISGMTREILSHPEASEETRRYIRRLGEDAAGLARVDLVFSHGDFRKDQLFFTRDGRIKIIDWECSGYFSRYYDLTEFFITEKWLYDNPAIRLESLLDVDRSRLSNVCSLYLLELFSFPMRFQRSFHPDAQASVVRSVEQRINKHVISRI